MIPILLLMALPYVLRSISGQRSAIGADIGAGPSPVMMAALGPAALLTTPQGKAAVAKGIVLAKNARAGNPKSRAKVKKIKQDAKRGDPKAKQAYAAMRTGQLLRENAQAQDEAEDDSDFDDEEEGAEEE